MRLEAKKEKNRLANLNIKKEGNLRAQYKTQTDDEIEVRRVAKTYIREYQDKVNALMDRVFIVQIELEIQEEELNKLKWQYQKADEELSELLQKFEEWKDHINRFNVQINMKITELEIEQKEL